MIWDNRVMTQRDPPPAGLKTAGRRLWRAVVDDYDLTAPELEILRQAARTADVLDRLAVLVAGDELVDVESGRAAAAVVEHRQQSLVLARLVAALRLPDGAGAARLQRRGVRGVYGVSGGAA